MFIWKYLEWDLLATRWAPARYKEGYNSTEKGVITPVTHLISAI